MDVRKFKRGDEQELWLLFYNTIHNINARDYNTTQIQAWAPDDIDMCFVASKYQSINPFVVIKNKQIVAYADIQANGYIDHFYCHHDYQGQGIGRVLFNTLENTAREAGIQTMFSNVSITARAFFQAMGFETEKEQLITIGDQQLTNFRMVRELT